MNQLSDREVFSALKKGNQEALSQLFLRYYDHLCHYGSQITTQFALVEECVQELFMYIFEAHHKLGDIQFVKAYLFQSLRRRILEKLKKERKIIRTDLTSEATVIQIEFSADDFIFLKSEKGCIRQTLAEILNQLPARQREAVYLRYYNNLSTREIAEVMGVANQTILNTLHQAIKKVRKNESLQQFFKTQVR